MCVCVHSKQSKLFTNVARFSKKKSKAGREKKIILKTISLLIDAT